MRISRRQALALCLSIGGLASFGMWHVASASAAPAAGASSSQCQALPAPSASASPTASGTSSASASPTAAASSAAPVDLCVSVQAAGDSVQQSQNADWTVQVWEQDGPVTGVTVTRHQHPRQPGRYLHGQVSRRRREHLLRRRGCRHQRHALVLFDDGGDRDPVRDRRGHVGEPDRHR